MVSLPMGRRDLVGALREFGWSGQDVTADVKDFQRGYALGPALLVDGKVGPLTREAIRHALREHRAGRPDASAWFSFGEFLCSCGGRYDGCRRVRVLRELLVALDGYRNAVGGPVHILSGYRCPEHNRRVGGATSSQHMYGAAADVSYRLSWKDVQRLRLFGGIGRSKRSGQVRHVDVRQVSGHNLTSGTPERPTVWDYAA